MERFSNFGRTEKEDAHNKLFFNLCNATKESKILDVPHIVFIGIHFFARLAVDCATNKEEALELINSVVNDVIKVEELSKGVDDEN